MRILYYDIDTLRSDHLGCYGYHRNTSPNIDKIASEGTIFRNCFCSDAPCLPSRASMFIGQFGIHSGIIGHGGTAADLRLGGKGREFEDERYNAFWIKLIRNRGYHTVSISPFAERHSAYWFYAPFKEIHNPGKKGMENADTIRPYIEKWLNENGKKDNWFLHINTWDPHTPYRTPMDYGNPFEDDLPPSWMTQEIIDEHNKGYGARSARDILGFSEEEKFFFKVFPRIKSPEIRTIKDFKSWIDGYDTGIHYADKLLGEIVEKIKELGIYDDTLIIISSDHGESQGELNVYGDHATADHIVNHVPMIIKWPNKKWKKEYSDYIYQTDVAASIICGLKSKIPDSWDGRSFLGELEANQKFGRKYLVVSQMAWSCQRSVIFDNWTLIMTYHTGLKDFPKIMLFDNQNDFHMLHNLAEEKPDIVGRGCTFLESWYAEMMENSQSFIDPMWTVMKEGGPYHSRGMLQNYLERLRKTGRENLVEKILNRNETYE
ncbi:MAG: sulfatase [Candidatus Lokiarchaeota archaeon]